MVRELQNYTTHFRVLALSATPGDKLETVQSVLSNLLIAHVEVWDTSYLVLFSSLFNLCYVVFK